MGNGAIHPFMEPRTIAIIGASGNANSVASRPLEFLKRYGFEGALYPINPKYSAIDGVRCYARLADVPEPIDLALLMVAASNVLETLQSCAAQGVKGALIYAGGFAELGEEGRKVQDQIAMLAKTSGMRILGPNCQGTVNFQHRMVNNFSSALQVGAPISGDIGITAQTGVVAGVLYPEARRLGLGINSMIATGNEADLDVSDCIDYFAQRDDIKSIVTYIESLKDYPNFAAAAEAAHVNQKPIIAIKPGRSAAAQQAAASHTGALAGEDRIYDAAFRKLNIIRVDEITEMMFTSMLFSNPKDLGAGRVAILTNSGGMGVMLSDLLGAAGFELATLSDATREVMSRYLPDFIIPGNPIDPSTGYLNPDIFDELFSVLEQDETVDLIVSFTGMAQVGTDYPLNRLVRAIGNAHRQGKKPIIPIWMASSVEAGQELRQRGVPVFFEARQAASSLGKMLGWQRGRRTASFKRPSRIPTISPSAHPTPLSVGRSTAIVEEWGIPVARSWWCRTAKEAGQVALREEGRLALKISSAHVPHKSDSGGLKLNLEAPGVEAAGEQMLRSFEQNGIEVDGLQVQAMAASGGLELIVGAKWDAVFGTVVMVGMGGIFAEVLDDTAIAIAPLIEADAMDMLRSLKGFALLNGARGQPPRDVNALAKLIATLSIKAAEAGPAVREVDLNPVFVYPAGEGVLAVDCLVVAG